MEVVVSVFLLTLFTAATTVAITSSTSTSFNNRARVGASTLAQRELEYVSREITQGDGAAKLRAMGEVANPHVTAELAAEGVSPGTASHVEFGFALDGTAYRVVRQVDRWAASSGSACDSETINDKTMIYGTLVTVTVTWEGMSQAAKPHTASQIFPPKRNETLALDPGQALLVVEVEGEVDATGSSRKAGVRIKLATASGKELATKVTDKKGCVAFEVTPVAGAEDDYIATALGDSTSTTWVSEGGATEPTVEFTDIVPGDSRINPIKPYDKAATLTVQVSGEIGTVAAVNLSTSSSEPGTQANIDETTNKAVFEHVYPGLYYVSASGLTPVPITLAPGSSESIELVFP
jgi:hypothetical protein